MVAIDTNVLVRLIVRDYPGQTAAAEKFIAQGAWASVLAVAEMVWVLGSVYDKTPAELATVIELLLQMHSLSIQDADAVAAALDEFRARPKLAFSDCLMVQLAKKAGHPPLGTFDKVLAKCAGARLL